MRGRQQTLVATPNPPLQSLQSNLKQRGRRGRRRASACTTAKAKFAARPPNPGTCRATHFTNVSKSLRRMSRYRLWSIKSGPSKAFSNAQGSGARQRTVSSSNRRACQSSFNRRLKYVMIRMCQQCVQRVVRHLIPKSLLRRRDPGQGLRGSQKMIRD